MKTQAIATTKELRSAVKTVLGACKGTVLELFLDMDTTDLEPTVAEMLCELDDLNESMDNYYSTVLQKVDLIFNRFDKDGKGVIEGAEYTDCIDALVAHMKSEFERELLEAIKKNIKAEGKSHEDIFKDMMQNKFKADDMKRLVIEMVDPDGDQKITKAEAVAGFKKVVDEIEHDASSKKKHIDDLADAVKAAMKFNNDASVADLLKNMDDLEQGMAGYGKALLNQTAEIFHRFDKDGNGVLEGDEFTDCIKTLLEHMKSEFERELRKVIEVQDTNGQDKETLFKKVMMEKFKEDQMKSLVTQMVDPNSDGKITLSEAILGFKKVVDKIEAA